MQILVTLWRTVHFEGLEHIFVGGGCLLAERQGKVQVEGGRGLGEEEGTKPETVAKKTSHELKKSDISGALEPIHYITLKAFAMTRVH